MAKKKATKKADPKKTVKKVSKKVVKKVVKKVTKKASAQKKTTKKASSKKVMTKKTVAKTTTKTTTKTVSAVKLQVGDFAPDFSLLDQNGKQVSLHDFKGKNVLVYFYPKAMTPGCTVQACELSKSQSRLQDAQIVVLGISADPVKSLKKFEEKEKLNFTLLSDPDHKIIESYGAWGPKKFMGREYDGIHRQSFLIDKDGKIVSIIHQVNTKTHHEDVLKFFTNL
jgi:thioredoxin-dependent peroxiredoxin